jgi:tripartite ATP-independent transporter DctM subunit
MFYWEDYLPVYMFAALGLLLFSGYPVAFVLGGIGLAFGFIGWSVDYFSIIEFYNILPRVWGGAAENPVLVAVPCFIFMGTMLERSGVANDLLHVLQVMMRRVPGGLALAVTIMGTIMAATTGIIGASVVMMTLLALPTMLRQNYSKELATGTLAASATLGILIPPSIMLVIMADLLAISVGNLFLAAIFPGLLLSLLYVVYIWVLSTLRPSMAPPLSADVGPSGVGQYIGMVIKGFVPPVFLITLVLGSIFAGIATPTEAAGVGAFGAIVLAAYYRNLNYEVIKEVVERTAMTTGMIFFILIGATAFSYVFRSLGGEDIIIEAIEATGFGSWGILFLLMGTVFFLGFFFDWIEITLIVLPVFAPIVKDVLDLGGHVAPHEIVYWFTILIAVNLQTSFLTPPFGFALFYMKGVAPSSVKMQQIYRGIIPFVGLQVIGLSLVIWLPEIAMWLPRQVLE